jgi:prepilin-type N-terminal cleavage/methylation domain-containing protein
MTFIKKFRAYSILELLVVVTIIGILAALAIGGFGLQRTRARDANRRSTVNGYLGGLQLYYQAKQSYLVKDKAGYGVGIRAGATRVETIAGVPTEIYTGQGWGRVTAKPSGDVNGNPQCDPNLVYANGPIASPTQSQSIADALFFGGYVNEVRPAAGFRGYGCEVGSSIQSSETFRDYFLAVCTRTGEQAALGRSGDNISDRGEEFTVYTFLEQYDGMAVPEREAQADVIAAYKGCGGPTTAHPWLNVITTEQSTTSLVSPFFTYSKGSAQFTL